MIRVALDVREVSADRASPDICLDVESDSGIDTYLIWLNRNEARGPRIIRRGWRVSEREERSA